MKTGYIGTVIASWMVGRHREAKIEFMEGARDFVLTANVGPNVNCGDRYQIELRKVQVQDGNDRNGGSNNRSSEDNSNVDSS